MELSSRVRNINESMTLKLNAKAVALAESGKTIFNLTAGQLPFRPMSEFVDKIRSESDFLRSFQYSPVAGYPELRKKIIQNFESTRNISLRSAGVPFDCVISNGGKHALTNVFGSLVDREDEVILFSPYWVSYPEMVKFVHGIPVIVETSCYDIFVPSIEEIRHKINKKTKIIVVNSPNNPTGRHYSNQWMQDFAELMLEFPHINIVCDEIYYELFYYDPQPTYFYQYEPTLLKRTIIIDGISKTLASTGLRIGYIIAPKELTNSVARLQGQTTSGANSLVQRALMNFDLNQIPIYLEPIKKHLRSNAKTLGSAFQESNMANLWYQPLSAFYYFVDFSQTPVIERYNKKFGKGKDHSLSICDDLLNDHGLALVPGVAFGTRNAARMSLVIEKEPFAEAVERLMKFMQN